MELSLISLVVFFEIVGTDSFKESVYKVSFIEGTIAPHKFALSVFLAIKKLSFVSLCSIVPDLLSKAMLLVILPVSLILTSVEVLENPISIGLIIGEIANVVLSV
jgi:hypothetical protein